MTPHTTQQILKQSEQTNKKQTKTINKLPDTQTTKHTKTEEQANTVKPTLTPRKGNKEEA